MPGLLRGVVRTAAVAGTATATRGAVNRRQAKKNVAAYSEAEQEVYAEQAQAQPVQAPPPPAAPAPQDDMITQLERLGAVLGEDDREAPFAQVAGERSPHLAVGRDRCAGGRDHAHSSGTHDAQAARKEAAQNTDACSVSC